MKSSSYYSRKASACRELGRWSAADEWARLAAKARKAKKPTRAARKCVNCGRPVGHTMPDGKCNDCFYT